VLFPDAYFHMRRGGRGVKLSDLGELCASAVDISSQKTENNQERTDNMIVLSPEGKAQTSAARVAPLPRFADLNGKVVGLLDNSKPNADKLEERFAQLLRERLDVGRVVTRRKISAQQGAPKEYLDELASQADFVISGLGD
jgi:hypothetical protein